MGSISRPPRKGVSFGQYGSGVAAGSIPPAWGQTAAAGRTPRWSRAGRRPADPLPGRGPAASKPSVLSSSDLEGAPHVGVDPTEEGDGLALSEAVRGGDVKGPARPVGGPPDGQAVAELSGVEVQRSSRAGVTVGEREREPGRTRAWIRARGHGVVDVRRRIG